MVCSGTHKSQSRIIVGGATNNLSRASSQVCSATNNLPVVYSRMLSYLLLLIIEPVVYKKVHATVVGSATNNPVVY